MSDIKRKVSKFIPLYGGVDEYSLPAEMENNRLRGEDKTLDIFIQNRRILKRPGIQYFGPYLYDDCYGLTEYIDPDGNTHLFIAGKGTVYEVGETALTPRDEGLLQEILHFQTHRGRCWYNGENTQRKITGTTAARVGVTAPENAPTLAEGAGTGLTGDFGFKYTFVIKESGVAVWESNLSPVQSIDVTSKDITVTPGISADSRVNCRRIYRTSASGTIYQEDGDIDNNTDGATYTSSQADVTLGSIAEENHGVPAQGVVSEGCNERMFWLVNSGSKARLYWSESAHTEPYQEYQKSTNYRELPLGGKGVWLKRVYNPQTQREDLYIAQESSIHLLPSGDPFASLANISTKIGGTSQGNVEEYNGKVIFLSNQYIVYAIFGNILVDLSSNNFPVSIKNFYDLSITNAGIIYDHYYCLCAYVSPATKHRQWICDLRTIEIVENNLAKATWFPWSLPITHILQRKDNAVVAFNTDRQRLMTLSFGNIKDEYGDCFFNEALKPVQVSGQFTDLTGSQTVQFDIYENSSGGATLWTESHTVSINSAGDWSADLGRTVSIPQAVITGMVAGTKYYLVITANSEEFSPRRKIPFRAGLKNKITSTSYSMIFTSTSITSPFATKFFGAENPSARRIATMIRITGKQQRKISVRTRYKDYFESKEDQEDIERDQGGSVMQDDGSTIWASPTTQVAMNMDESLEPGDGGAVSFEFEKSEDDSYFECEGIQYHYTELRRF